MTRTARLGPLLLAAALAAAARAGERVEAQADRVARGTDATPAHPLTTIRYALWGGANEVAYTREICRRFVAEHPDIAVEFSVYPWGQYWAKLQTQAASGLAPDVISLYSRNMGVWIARGALRPLDDLVAASRFPLDAYHRAAVENCRWDGRLHAMPIEIPVRSLVFSLDRLEEAGIPREEWPRPDRALSWEPFQTLTRRLTLRGPDGQFTQYGMACGIGWNERMARLHGGDFLDRPVDPTRSAVAGNEPLARGLIEVFRAQYADRTVLGQIPLASGAFSSGDTILLSPKFAMSITGPWALESLKQGGVRFGLAPTPRGPTPSVLVCVNAVGIYAHSRHVDAAWKFVSFMASEPVQSLFGRKLKGVPAMIAARESLLRNDAGIQGCEAFLQDLEVASPDLTSANSYVPAALAKWLSVTEQSLDEEYDRRHRALAAHPPVSDAAYARFVAHMDGFVASTIRDRLPVLDRELAFALDRARPRPAGPLVRWVLPVLALVAGVAALAAYLRAVLRAQPPAVATGRAAGFYGYLCILPWLLGCLCFVLGPILAAAALSFTEYNMIAPPRWVGFVHYANLPSDPSFLIGLQRTFAYAALVIPISLFGGLFTAGLLTCDIRGRDAFKAILYFPSLFTGAAMATLWVNMFNKEYGVVNRLLDLLNLPPVSWLDQTHAFYTVVLMNVFWIGGAMIVYYAGMKQIPAALYEAAEVDGAGPVRKFWHITIPLLSPVILFLVVMTTIGAFQVFTPAVFLASSSASIGEPGDSLRFYSVNIYDEAFNNLRMGQACCQALILFFIVFAVTMIQMRLARRFVHSEA
jgi:multiple sugar transport system permease protein